MLFALIWKEAREHLWKLVALSAMVISPLLVLNLLQHTSWGGFRLTEYSSIIICLAAFISPIWIASWTVASEKNSRTLSTLLVLPLNRFLPFIIKVIFGILTLIIPLALGLYLSQSWNSDILNTASPSGNADFFPALFASAITFYFMILALTMSLRRESTVAMVGVLIVAFCFLWLNAVNRFFGDSYFFNNQLWTIFSLFGNPFLILLSPDPRLDKEFSFRLLILFYAIASAMWFRIAAARFGKSSLSSSRAELPAAPSIRMTPITPMHDPRLALFWKEWTEQRWIIISCFIAGILLATLISFLTGFQYPGTDILTKIIGDTTQNLNILALIISCIAAIVLGVGSYTTDLDPALVNFWHGLPIPIPRWFRTKYLVSLVGLCALLTAQIAIAYFVASLIPGPAAGIIGTLHEQTLQNLLGGLILLPLVHAFATFFAALIRRPIYAAILAIIFSITLVMIPINKNTQVGEFLFNRALYDQLLFVLCIITSALATLTLILTSRLALTKNWHLT